MSDGDRVLIRLLSELIQLDHDASSSYELALQHVDDEHDDVRTDLSIFMRDHQRHITELNVVIEALGGARIEPSRHLQGVLLDGMTRLRSATGTWGALKAMRANERRTNRSYEDALAMNLPPVARDVIRGNVEDERQHLAAIEEHLTTLREDREIDDLDDEEVRTDNGVATGRAIVP